MLAHDWRSSSSMVCSNDNSEILDEPAEYDARAIK